LFLVCKLLHYPLKGGKVNAYQDKKNRQAYYPGSQDHDRYKESREKDRRQKDWNQESRDEEDNAPDNRSEMARSQTSGQEGHS
jgi:hypothetical protein